MQHLVEQTKSGSSIMGNTLDLPLFKSLVYVCASLARVRN